MSLALFFLFVAIELFVFLLETVRTAVAASLKVAWNRLTTAERHAFVGTYRFLSKEALNNICDTLLRAVLSFSPFEQGQVEVITYLAAEEGISLLRCVRLPTNPPPLSLSYRLLLHRFLANLRGTRAFTEPLVKDKLDNFHRFWKELISQLVKQTVGVDVVDVFGQREFRTFEDLHELYEETGGAISQAGKSYIFLGSCLFLCP